MRITGPGVAVEIRRGRKDDPRGEYLMLAIAGAPDLPQALQQALRQAVAQPWTVALPFGAPAAWPWMPMPVDPWALWALSARPMQAWLDLWRAWAEAWLPEPAAPRQE